MLRHDPCFRSTATSGLRCALSGSGQRRFSWAALQKPTVAVAVLWAMLTLLPAGCGGSRDRPATAPVHGRVTLDGNPLPHVRVVFHPEEVAGRDSSGITDDNGEYVLKYIRDELGGAIGKNSVRISIQRTPDPNTETLPLRYNQQTTLVADVKAGTNEINFDLTSEPRK
jgi:hypothetical protein